jgi:putative DNA primase/helicase
MQTKDTTESLQKAVEARVRAEDSKIEGSSGSEIDITSSFISDCLQANEFGDGCLFAALHKAKFVYGKLTGEWFYWAGHHWKRDIRNRAAAMVETIAQCYLEEATNLEQMVAKAQKEKDSAKADALENRCKAFYKRVKRLRSERGRNNCLKFAHTNNECSLDVEGEEFDQKWHLLPCRNGVIDLRTGELQDGRPEDFLLKASPVNFEGIDKPAPFWSQALQDIFQENDELIEFVGRLLGYCITGLVKEHVLPVFYGQGRNGKGTLVETLKFILGDLAAPIQSEMLLDQGRIRSSSGPSPDIMGLRGLRLAFASESDEGRRFSTSKVKLLTGGDTLIGRNPHDKHETRFKPTHKLILITNNKPRAPADDYAFWERATLIPFSISFVNREPKEKNERRADPELDLKLQDEASGILAWLVRNCLAYQERGLDPPPIIKQATAEYRRDEDLLADFLDEFCFKSPGTRVGASDIYTAFRGWWEAHVSKRSIPSQKKFGRWMSRKFDRRKDGTFYYLGVNLLDDRTFLDD